MIFPTWQQSWGITPYKTNLKQEYLHSHPPYTYTPQTLCTSTKPSTLTKINKCIEEIELFIQRTKKITCTSCKQFHCILVYPNVKAFLKSTLLPQKLSLFCSFVIWVSKVHCTMNKLLSISVCYLMSKNMYCLHYTQRPLPTLCNLSKKSKPIHEAFVLSLRLSNCCKCYTGSIRFLPLDYYGCEAIIFF